MKKVRESMFILSLKNKFANFAGQKFYRKPEIMTVPAI